MTVSVANDRCQFSDRGAVAVTVTAQREPNEPAAYRQMQNIALAYRDEHMLKDFVPGYDAYTFRLTGSESSSGGWSLVFAADSYVVTISTRGGTQTLVRRLARDAVPKA